ncbi:MAG: extensin family protein [Rhodobacterales bacterium]
MRPQARLVTLALVALMFSASACGFRSDRASPRSGASSSGYPMICGDPALRGEVVGRVPGGITGCGIDNAVRLHEVNGVQLSTGAVVDCPTAKAFKTWVARGMTPAVGNQGGGVESIRIAASYACRTRNHQAGARISEHGRGKAIDVSGYTLRDGTQVTVLRDWGSGRNGRALRQMHRAACGPFGTVLGPDADRFHLDHFHFDTARHRGGAYCR